MDKQKAEIPSFELLAENKPVDFIFKHIQEPSTIHGYREDLPHRHNYYTVLWPISMKGRHVIDYKEYIINEDEIFFVSPEQVHQVFIDENPDGILLLFTCAFLDQHFINKDFIKNLGLFEEISDNPPIKIDKITRNYLKNLVDEIEKTYKSHDLYMYEKIGAFLKLFLIECNKFAPGLKSDNTQAIQSAKQILRKFKDTLEQNFVLHKQVGDYADILNITPDYLNSVIKSGIGKTAKELIQQRIVLEAKRLGLHTGLSTKEIAYKLGYDDPSHFSRFFKTVEGINFSDFREMLNKSF